MSRRMRMYYFDTMESRLSASRGRGEGCSNVVIEKLFWKVQGGKINKNSQKDFRRMRVEKENFSFANLRNIFGN